MNSEQTYMLSKLRKKCKEYFFINSLHLDRTNKNPLEMSEAELLTFVDKYNLGLILAETMNDAALKFLKIQNKFKEAKVSKIPKDVIDILYRLMKKSENSYLIGGCTRDIILGLEPKDYDFVTDISYSELKELFSECKFKETGTEFLVFNLNYNGLDYEIANYRKDSLTSADSRRPDFVEIGTIEEDQNRRDFTANNIGWNPKDLRITEESLDDILEKKLRFVGRPEERLHEDFLRGWRFLRLVKTKNLTPDKESLRAVRRNWEKIYNSSNSHRVMLELEKLCLK